MSQDYKIPEVVSNFIKEFQTESPVEITGHRLTYLHGDKLVIELIDVDENVTAKKTIEFESSSL